MHTIMDTEVLPCVEIIITGVLSYKVVIKKKQLVSKAYCLL